MNRLACFLFGHRLRFVRFALEGGKIFRCERCGMVLWKTPAGWYELGRD
ncbi:MAG TPA: hypothetical protein PKY50_06050 [Candidatus Competibacter sp.]|nr:hypothetical protein [Candidatus Competibacter sp.]